MTITLEAAKQKLLATGLSQPITDQFATKIMSEAARLEFMLAAAQTNVDYWTAEQARISLELADLMK